MITNRGGIAPSLVLLGQNQMERRVKGNFHARCGAGENPEMVSKDDLSLSGAKSQGIKQLMGGGGIIIVAQTVLPELSKLFSTTPVA